jgi:hypothetical protein
MEALQPCTYVDRTWMYIPLKRAYKDLQPQIDKLQLHKHKGYDTPRNFDMNTLFLPTRQCISGQSQGFEFDMPQLLTWKLDIVEKSVIVLWILQKERQRGLYLQTR